MIPKKFLILEHTADLKIRVFGSTLEELFINALIGMFQSIRPIIPGCRTQDHYVVCDTLPITRELSLTSHDQHSLLIDFLNEALYLSDVHNEVYLNAHIHLLQEQCLVISLYGVTLERFEGVEIKAVTYHGGMIQNLHNQYQVDIVFDV